MSISNYGQERGIVIVQKWLVGFHIFSCNACFKTKRMCSSTCLSTQSHSPNASSLENSLKKRDKKSTRKTWPSTQPTPDYDASTWTLIGSRKKLRNIFTQIQSVIFCHKNYRERLGLDFDEFLWLQWIDNYRRDFDAMWLAKQH